MAAIRSSGNKNTELRLLAEFKRRGIMGWRRRQNLPGKPDFVFRKERVAVFVDGCFARLPLALPDAKISDRVLGGENRPQQRARRTG